MRLWRYDEDAILQEEQNERKKRFQKIGEDVFSFFQDKAIATGFEDREGQWEMSCEIVDGIRENKHVLVQTVDKVLRETSVSRSIFLCVYEIYSENRKFSLGLCHP